MHPIRSFDRPARRGEGGFVVFGVLMVLVALIAGAVLLGVIIDRLNRPPAEAPLSRELRYATAPLEVRFGALTTRRLEAGDPVWVQSRGDREVLVFESRTSNRIIGYAPEDQLSPIPPEGARAARRPARR